MNNSWGGASKDPECAEIHILKKLAHIFPNYERLRPKIGMAMQGTWKIPGPLHISGLKNTE